VVTSDVQEFTAALDAGDRERAIALYHGPFLDGFYLSEAPEFERWVEEERARLHARYRAALEGAAAQLQSVELWCRLVTDDPLASRPLVQLVRSLIAAGDRVEAQRRLRAHRALLEEERIPVSPEILALDQELRVAVAPPSPPVTIASAPSATRAEGASAERAAPVARAGCARQHAAHCHRDQERRALTTRVPVVAVGLIESHLRRDTVGLARSLPDLITTQLAQVSGLTVVSRGRLLEVLGSDVRLPGSGALARGARSAGAGEIIEGAIYEDPGGFRLDLRRVNLAGGKVNGAVSVTGSRPADVVERGAAALAATYGLDAPATPLASITSVSLVARRLYEEGLRAYYGDDRTTAAQLFQAALEDDSTFAMAAYYLALTQVGTAPDSEAAYWSRATRLAPRASDRERLLIQAAAAFTQDDARALAIAETLTVRYPDDIDGKQIIGERRLAEGNFVAATAAFLSVARADSVGRRGAAGRCRSCDAMHRAVWVSLTADSLDQAERLAREVIRWNPYLPGGYGLLGMVQQRRWRFDEALATYQRQHEVSPPSVTLRPVMLLIAQRKGDFVALDSLATTMLHASQDPQERYEALRWRATIEREAGRIERSLRAAREARRLSDSLSGGKTGHAFVLLPEALALLERGRHDRRAAQAAAAVFDTMARMASFPEPRMARHRVWMWTHQATALALAGDTASLPELERRIADAARHSAYGRDKKMPAYVRGLLLEARGDQRGAAAYLAEAIWSPTENHVSPRLGALLVRSGRAVEAIPVLQAWLRGPLDAANQYVSRAWAHLALAEAFSAVGQQDSAAWHSRWVDRAWDKADPEYARVVAALH
jgi:tetratricopeptide (TPR) repeat protein